MGGGAPPGAPGDDTDETRLHYDLHSNKHATQEEALRARELGASAPLKKYHNDIKRRLITRFAKPGGRLLDLACGRGGDIRKWFDANIAFVKGIDLSPGEIQEAESRYAGTRKDWRYRMSRTQCVFVATDKVGKEDLGLGNEEPYDAVTCMFAIHYFFATEQTLHCFLRNASAALADRGFFFGTCPDGKAVMAGVQKGGGQSLHLPMLRLTRMWEGKEPQPFGSKYTCHIADTVVEGHEGITEGSVEYLVFFSVMRSVARQYDLFPVEQHWGKELDGVLARDEPQDKRWCRHFDPHFPDSDPSLEEASRLFVAFVFQKREPVNKRHLEQSADHAAAVLATGGVAKKRRTEMA